MKKHTTFRTTMMAAAVLGALACAPGYARDEGVTHGGVNTPTPGGNNVVGQQPYGPPGGAIGNPPGAPFATQDRDSSRSRNRESVGGTAGMSGSGQTGDKVYPKDRPGMSPSQRGVKTPSSGGMDHTPEPAPNAGPSTSVTPRAVPTPGGNNVVGQNPYGPPGGAVANPPGAPMYQGGTTGGTAAGTSGTAPGKVNTPMSGGNNAGHGVNKQ